MWPEWGDVLPTLAMVATLVGAFWTAARISDRTVSRAVEKAGRQNDRAIREAIEALYDKLKANDFRHMEAGLAHVRGDVTQLATGLTEVGSEVGQLRTGLVEVKSEVGQLRTGLADVRGEVAKLRTGLADVRGEFAEFRTGLTEVRGEVRQLRADLGGRIDRTEARLVRRAREDRQAMAAGFAEIKTLIKALPAQRVAEA